MCIRDRVKAAVEFIRANYDQRLTLDMIAKNALTDKYRLSHCFKAFTGLTIFQYINDYRLSLIHIFFPSKIAAKKDPVTALRSE